MPIETTADARATIMQAAETAEGGERVLEAVAQWGNTTDNGFGVAGDIWVANPQTGHWLKDDQLVQFANFLETYA